MVGGFRSKAWLVLSQEETDYSAVPVVVAIWLLCCLIVGILVLLFFWFFFSTCLYNNLSINEDLDKQLYVVPCTYH